MASLDAILCSEPHVAPLAYEPARQAVPVPAEREAAPDEKTALGKPPFPLSGSRRKSGWGKRFKEREQGRLAIIFPRRKMGETARGSDAVWLSVDVLNSLADRSLASAAKLLVSPRRSSLFPARRANVLLPVRSPPWPKSKPVQKQ
jgi:hypothetical protein